MAFYPIQIAPTPGFGFVGGPEFSTDIKNLQSGREKRNGDWSVCRHKYTAPFLNISNEAYLNVKEVFLICRGKLHTFLHRDWSDFNVSNEKLAVGDGATREFQLHKLSLIGAASYDRVITKPDDDVTITVDGVPTASSTDPLTGIVSLSAPPLTDQIIRWSGTFFVQVRFDIDYLPWSLDDRNSAGYVTNGSVDLIEVLDE